MFSHLQFHDGYVKPSTTPQFCAMELLLSAQLLLQQKNIKCPANFENSEAVAVETFV